jgi:serine/alanine adding enzyme
VLALLAPVEVTVFGGLLCRLTTRAVAYGSVLYDPAPAGQEALKALLSAYVRTVKRRPVYTELRNLSDLSQGQSVLRNCGFAYTDHLNYLVDLARSPEAIMQSIGRRTRKQIRHALRQGQVTIGLIKTREELASWYAVLQQTYRRARVPLAERSLFEVAFDVLHPRGMIEFRSARVGNAVAAVSVELLYRDVIYGWYGGTDRSYGYLYPNEVLTWRILESGAQRGYKVYDFGGAGQPGEVYGVRDFKAKFGGDIVGFGRNICVHSPFLFRLSTLGYRAYRMAQNTIIRRR